MGFDEGLIVLDSPNGTYFSGQTVRGHLKFTQEKAKTFRGIYVKMKGYCKVHWTTTHTMTVNGKTQTYTKSHDSYEEYINIKTFLVGGESGEYTINPGTHEYHFVFTLPNNCPSSFEGSYGHVRYEIKAVVDRSFIKFDQEKKVAVRVMVPLDLNIDPYCRNPLELEFQDSYCCCCMGFGSAGTSVKLPVSGYCPGQTIPIELICSNKSNVEIDSIKIEITRKYTFTATRSPGTCTSKDIVVEIKKGSIPSNTSRNWTVEMMMPALDVYNLHACQYIDVNYKFKVTINPSGCHKSTDGSQRIVIGTIPLVGFQDNVQNQLADQMPKQMITAVTQQPMPSFPVTSPYPASPYSPVVHGSKYPNNVSSYLQTTLPHPPTASPYPPNASPYPNTASPYPSTTAPYPNTASPYPPTASPYPNTSPYPACNSSYPSADHIAPGQPSDNPPPYPGNYQNYPSNSSPYPGTDLPYSPRQEKLGFQVPGAKGDNDGSPAHNTGAPAAYPSCNPYAAASAPALDSPDAR